MNMDSHNCSTCPVAGQNVCLAEGLVDWIDEHAKVIEKAINECNVPIGELLEQTIIVAAQGHPEVIAKTADMLLVWAFYTGWQGGKEEGGGIANLDKVYGK